MDHFTYIMESNSMSIKVFDSVASLIDNTPVTPVRFETGSLPGGNVQTPNVYLISSPKSNATTNLTFSNSGDVALYGGTFSGGITASNSNTLIIKDATIVGVLRGSNEYDFISNTSISSNYMIFGTTGTVRTTLNGVSVGGVFTGPYYNGSSACVIDKYVCNLSNVSITKTSYLSGYIYGNSAPTTMTIKQSELMLDSVKTSYIHCGPHARSAANILVNSLSASIIGGSHTELVAGGWAEKNGNVHIDNLEFIIIDSTITRLYCGGANADGTTTVGTARVQVKGNALIDTIYCSGRYGYSTVGSTYLSFSGVSKSISRLDGTNSAGEDTSCISTVELNTNLTAEAVHYISKFIINHPCKLTISSEFYPGSVNTAGSTTTIDLVPNGNYGWTFMVIPSSTNKNLLRFSVDGETAEQIWNSDYTECVLTGKGCKVVVENSTTYKLVQHSEATN